MAAFLNGGTWRLVDEFVEVEVGPGLGSPGARTGFGPVPVMGATLIVANASGSPETRPLDWNFRQA